MRIIIAHKYLFRGGGTATYLFGLWEELKKRGHEVVPFTVAYDQTVPREYQKFYVSPPGSGRETHLRQMKLSPGRALKLLGRATWSTEAYHKAQALVDVARPDLAYVHNLYNYMSPSPLAAFKRRGLPVVMRVPDLNMACPGLTGLRDGKACLDCLDHGLIWSLKYRCHKGSLAGTACRVATMAIHRWLGVYNHVDLFVTPSEFMAGVLRRLGISDDRIVHIPSFYRPKNGSVHEPTSDDPRYVLYFGRVSAEKGIGTLVRAARELPEGVEAWVAGGDRDGERARLEALAGELGVSNVRFLGHQEPEDLEALVNGALFTVVPSLWYDNCPMAVLESFARGRAVVGSRIGGIPEQIGEDCGLLFEPGNAGELAEKMRWLIAHPDEREEMGRVARRKCETVYSPDAHCDRLLGFFRALVAREEVGANAAPAVQ